MQMKYYQEPSRFLKREMEFKVYGHGGQPCLVFPCEGGRFFDWEDHGMLAALAPLLEGGKLQLFCADSVDGESWLGTGDERERTEMQERWFNYICKELVPRCQELSSQKEGTPSMPLLLGISLGAGQALNLLLRRPSLFSGAVCLSGSYLSEGWFGSYQDDLLLRNSPLHQLRLLPAAEAKARTAPLLLACGRGPYEERFEKETLQLSKALQQCGLAHELKLYDEAYGHDWCWWQQEILPCVQQVLEALS